MINMKNILFFTLYLLILINPIKTYSQKNDDAAIIAGAASLLSIYTAVEQQKEMLELQALNYLLSNHPEYSNFRLKVIGFGQGGQKLSDNSNSYMIPFSLINMDDEKLTSDKKLLFLFISSNWLTDNGIDYSKWRWEIYDAKKWNHLMSEYFETIAYSSILINNDSIDVFTLSKGYVPKSNQIIGYDYLIKFNIVDDKKVPLYYVRNNTKVHISKVNITKEGLTSKIGKSRRKLIYPFLQLEGDDYRVKDFDHLFKIFCNENSLGLFRKDTKDSMLISRVLLRKIHTFINDNQIEDFKD